MEVENREKHTQITRPEIPRAVEHSFVEKETQKDKTAQIAAEVVNGLLGQIEHGSKTLKGLNDRFGGGRPLFGTDSEVGNLATILQGETEKIFDAANSVQQAIIDNNQENGPSIDPKELELFYDLIESESIKCRQIIVGIPEERRIPKIEKKLDTILDILTKIQEMIVTSDQIISDSEKIKVEREISGLRDKYLNLRLELVAYRADVDEDLFLEDHNPYEAADILERGRLHPSLEHQAIYHRMLRQKSFNGDTFENALSDELDKLMVPELQGRNIYQTLTEPVLLGRTGDASRLLAHQLLNGYLSAAYKSIDFLIQQDPNPFLKELKTDIRRAIENQKDRRDLIGKMQESLYHEFSKELREDEYVVDRKEKEEIMRNGDIVSFGYLEIKRRDGSMEPDRGIFTPQVAVFEYNGKRVRAVVKFAFTDRAARPGVVPGTGPERSVLESTYRLGISSILPKEDAIDVMKSIPITTAREISVPVLSGDNNNVIETQSLGWAEVTELLEDDVRQFELGDVAKLTEDQKKQLMYMALFAIKRGRNDGADRNMLVTKEGRLVEIDFSSEGSCFDDPSLSGVEIPQVSLAHLLMEEKEISGTPLKLAQAMISTEAYYFDNAFSQITKSTLPIDAKKIFNLLLGYKKRIESLIQIVDNAKIPKYVGDVNLCGDARYIQMSDTNPYLKKP